MQVGKTYLFVAIVSILLLCQCNRHIDKNVQSNLSTLTVEASYESIHQNIIVPYCIKCHQDDFGNYDSLVTNMKNILPGDPNRSEFYVRVMMPPTDQHFMPKKGSKLPEVATNAIRDWIKNGAKPGSLPKEPPVVQKVEATYSSINENIVKPFCMKCHQGDETDFGSFDALVKNSGSIVEGDPDASAFYKRVVLEPSSRGFMPKKGQKLSEQARKAIYEWIKNGAKP